MHFYIGGAYQGKLDCAKRRFSLADTDVYDCEQEGAPRLDAPCVYAIEAFTLRCVREGVEPADYFKARKADWQNSVLICRDIFCGVVPVEAELRAWRDATGRLAAYLAGEAETVTRVFCGLEQTLK